MDFKSAPVQQSVFSQPLYTHNSHRLWCCTLFCTGNIHRVSHQCQVVPLLSKNFWSRNSFMQVKQWMKIETISMNLKLHQKMH